MGLIVLHVIFVDNDSLFAADNKRKWLLEVELGTHLVTNKRKC
jgi:hypothetical protein